SMCLYAAKEGFIITGDVLFYESIGRSDLPTGNSNTLITNIKNKLLVLPDNTIVYPGHGPSTTIGNEKRNNPYLE
ncbi:MAG TPA: MBL fold metallo-hydrolase, partial [Bacteroidales bacterium]|nr:MBL fold metallo-hydrolase [Bacteroidales bacterium]